MASTVEDNAVIAAADIVALDLSLRKRQQSVWTGVLQSDGSAVELAIQNNRLTANSTSERPIANISIPGCDIPLIAKEHGRLLYV
jgi:hypothetical protein